MNTNESMRSVHNDKGNKMLNIPNSISNKRFMRSFVTNFTYINTHTQREREHSCSLLSTAHHDSVSTTFSEVISSGRRVNN